MKKYLSIMSGKTKIKCMLSIVLALVSAFLASIWPVKLGELYTEISNGSMDTIIKGAVAIIYFGLIFFLAECTTIIRRVFLDCTIVSHEAETREYSIGKLLRMPIAYYSGCLSGEKTSQLNQGVTGYSQLIKILCNDVVATILTAICTIIQVFFNAPGVIVAIMFTYLILTIMISVFQIHSQNGIRESIIEQKNALDGQICQSINNLEWIRSINAEEYEKKRLCPSILNISRTEKKHHKYMGFYDCLKQVCKVTFQVILLAASIWLISNGEMSAGSVISVCLLFQQLIQPIEEVYRFIDETASSVIKAKALLEVAQSSCDAVFNIGSSGEDCRNNEILLENVVVTNPEKNKSLAWYEKTIIPGRKITALQGPNGSGKTSLVRCLNRYYPHRQGKIMLFGRPQESYDQKELTDLLYYTPQTSFFIAGTVRENLVYGLTRTIDDEELIKALENVHLTGTGHTDTVIHTNPKEALDYMIGEKADELSGGMKQRLSLARAFLRHPKVFIFDEITANLDRKAVDFLLFNIETYANDIGAGIVYISHDQQVIDRCDEVIVLKNKIRKCVRKRKEVA